MGQWHQGNGTARRKSSQDQFFPKNADFFKTPFFFRLSLSEVAVFELLTFIAWSNFSWEIQASAEFISERLGHRLKPPAIRRHLKKLMSLRLIAKTRCGRKDQHVGSYYLVASCLVPGWVSEKMEHHFNSGTLLARAHKVAMDEKERERQLSLTPSDALPLVSRLGVTQSIDDKMGETWAST